MQIGSKHAVFFEQLADVAALLQGVAHDVLALAHRFGRFDDLVDHRGRNDEHPVDVTKYESPGATPTPPTFTGTLKSVMS